MNLSFLGDQKLLDETLRHVREEREKLFVVLHHLREVNSRRLFSSLGCPSLHDYAVKELRYPEDQAQRRITAMWLLKELPEIGTMITEGSLTLTNIGLAKAVFKRKNSTREEKLEIFGKIKNMSVRQAAKVLSGISPGVSKNERMRRVSPDQTEIRFNASDELLGKLEQLKGLLAHKHPGLNMAELLEKACDLGIAALSPAAPRDTARKPSVRKIVWKKAEGKCENCKSQFALELDHIFPKGMGGTNKPENLRLLCRNCNQRAAINVYGAEKMEAYMA